MKKLVGLTGGIGSGKTLVASIFKTLGIPVFDSDNVAKRLMNEDKSLIKSIIDAFGADVYSSDGVLNRELLAERVFGDRNQLERLNGLVHPAVRKALKAWIDEHLSAPYFIQEAAILFESGAFKHCDKVITVYAPESLRIDRVMQRDETKKHSIRQRIDRQINDATRIALSDYIVVNDGSIPLIPQIHRLHLKLLDHYVEK